MQPGNSGPHLPEIASTGREAGYGSSCCDADRRTPLDAVPGLQACVAPNGCRGEASGVSELRHDVLGGGARVEEDDDAGAAGVACRDGLAGVFAVRAPVVCAFRGVAGAVRAAEVRVALLAPGAGAWGGGEGRC